MAKDLQMADFVGGVTGFRGQESRSPEEEFFHSVYISGLSRSNHIGIVEKPGRLQIRGVDYNLDDVYMIILHVKTVLVKNKQINNQEIVECFSYQDSDPFKGTSNRICPRNSAERSATEFCKDCRSHIIVAGILCDSNGKPRKDPEGKAIFGFLRAKGTKYSPVNNYLNDLYRLDLDPIFLATKESKEFEKTFVNHKRFVTRITIGSAHTNFGDKSVFELSKLSETPLKKEQVQSLLKLSKETVEEFHKKFDWSRTMTTYVKDTEKAASSGLTPFDDDSAPAESEKNEEKTTKGKKADKTKSVEEKVDEAPAEVFNFEDISI